MPGTPASEIGVGSSAPLVREGAFVSNARGRAVRGKSGRWYFVFDPDAGGRTLPAMVLLESPNLASIERLVEQAPAETRLRVSGQVTVYRDRNFFLVTVPPLLERASEAGASSVHATPPSEPESAQPARSASPGAEPTMEEIIADLDRVVGARRDTAATRPSTGATLAQETPTSPDQGASEPEGQDRFTGYLVARRGRLVRAADGSLIFRTDSGSAGRTEPAYRLLPCQNLTSLEAWSDAAGDGSPLTVSGEVFHFHSRTYLLPSMYTVPRQTDVVLPTQ